MRTLHQGFTLLEIIIVLAILSLLAAVAYPSYTQYRLKTQRTDGQTALHTLALQMERYFTENNTYNHATFQKLGLSDKSTKNLYQLKITPHNNGNGYQLDAAPIGYQVADKQCGILSLDQKGKKTISGTGKIQDCW
jgi:type IV pilus assembly protein PilE